MGTEPKVTTTVIIGVWDTDDVEIADTEVALHVKFGTASLVFHDMDQARILADKIVAGADNFDAAQLNLPSKTLYNQEEEIPNEAVEEGSA